MKIYNVGKEFHVNIYGGKIHGSCNQKDSKNIENLSNLGFVLFDTSDEAAAQRRAYLTKKLSIITNQANENAHGKARIQAQRREVTGAFVIGCIVGGVL